MAETKKKVKVVKKKKKTATADTATKTATTPNTDTATPVEASATATTTVDTPTFAEQLKQATKDFSAENIDKTKFQQASKNVYIMKKDAERAGSIRIDQEQGTVTGVSIRNGNKEMGYKFAAFNSQSKDDQVVINTVPHPEYTERTVVDTSDKNSWKRTQTDIRENYYYNTEEKRPEIQTFKSVKTVEVSQKGKMSTERTTKSDDTLGERTDTAYTPDGQVQIESSSLHLAEKGVYKGNVQVRMMSKDKMITGEYQYEGTPTKDGKINYSLKGESYHIDKAKDSKVNATEASQYDYNPEYNYIRSENGEIRREQYNDSGALVQSQKISPDKQMKKDFAKYQKTMQKLIKQTTKYKSAQDYMDHTPQATPSTVREVNPQQQSLEYVDKAKQAVQQTLLNRAMQKQY